MDSRLAYLMTRLPPLPAFGEAPPLTLADALGLLRQQGGGDLELLAGLLEAEASLRSAMEEWIVNPPGSRAVPDALPLPLRAFFDEELVARTTEDDWVGALWQAYLDLLGAAGRRLGSPLLSRWSGRETSLRLNLALRRSRARGDREEPGRELPPVADPGLEAALAAWDAARSHGADPGRFGAAMEAEVSLDRSRLALLEEESRSFSFTADELVAYLLRLRLLERQHLLDRGRGRALLKEIAAL